MASPRKAASFLGLLFAATTCFAQMYTVTELDRLAIPTSAYLTPGGINNSGEAVYSLGVHSYYSRGFRTDPNSAISHDVGYLCCVGVRTIASSINDSGQVAGTSLGSDQHDHAFRTAPNSPINPATDDLGTLGIGSHGSAINNSGQVVGWSWVSGDEFDGVAHAFRTAPDSPINVATDDLGTLGGINSLATSINATGEVVGYSSVSGDIIVHGFRTAPNTSINPATDDLGTLGGSESYAYGINAFGQVIGYSATSGDGAIHAFRTAPNTAINPATDDLGALVPGSSYAWGINSWGEVVGSFDDGQGPTHAFLYSDDTMHDLNGLIAVEVGYSILDAVAINNVGQVLVSTSEPGSPPDGPFSYRGIALLTPIYKGLIQHPIAVDGSSVFSTKRGVIPVKFVVMRYGSQPSCTLPATISVTRAVGGALEAVDESQYSTPADDGAHFRVDSRACEYVYNLAASSLGGGTYRVDISINGIFVGHAGFALK